MAGLKTLSRQDPDFLKYLEGTFSKDERALPIQSLNVNSESESVTFQIVPVGEIQAPGFLLKWLEVFKFRYFMLLAFPAFVILVKDLFDEAEMDAYLILFSILASCCLISAANLWNDYNDHMRGLDRVHPESQKKPIQKGWVTASSTKKWAAAYLLLGVLAGLPALIVQPVLWGLVAVPGAVALWAWLSPSKGKRFRRGTEILIFLLVGPLFTTGFQLSASGGFDYETLWIGIMTGWIAVFLVHLRNFEAIMVNTQAGFQSTVVGLGFEKSKVLLASWWILLWISFCAYQAVYTPLLMWSVGSVVAAVLTSYAFFRRLWALKSPMGSDIESVVSLGRRMVNLFWAWWLIQCFWILLILEMSSQNSGA